MAGKARGCARQGRDLPGAQRAGRRMRHLQSRQDRRPQAGRIAATAAASGQVGRVAGVKTAKPGEGLMAEGIECYAEFGFNLNKFARIAAPVGGVIQEVTVDLGSKVTDQQPVARIWSAADRRSGGQGRAHPPDVGARAQAPRPTGDLRKGPAGGGSRPPRGLPGLAHVRFHRGADRRTQRQAAGGGYVRRARAVRRRNHRAHGGARRLGRGGRAACSRSPTAR